MSEIEIPFRADFKDRMLEGKKRATTRYKKYGEPGDTFKWFGATFEIESIEQLPLGEVAEDAFREEGFNTPQEFRDCWIEIHPRRGFVDSDLVWLHMFVRVK